MSMQTGRSLDFLLWQMVEVNTREHQKNTANMLNISGKVKNKNIRTNLTRTVKLDSYKNSHRIEKTTWSLVDHQIQTFLSRTSVSCDTQVLLLLLDAMCQTFSTVRLCCETVTVVQKLQFQALKVLVRFCKRSTRGLVKIRHKIFWSASMEVFLSHT